jgi:hypothetical protein
VSVFTTIAAVASGQYGTITTSQLDDMGVTSGELRTFIARGVLERVGSGVYAVAGSPATWHQRLAVAVHRGGPLAVVSHRSAAALWRLDRYRPGHVDTTGPWDRGRTGPDTTRHRSTELPARDRTSLAGLPVTTPTRTLIDMGRYVGTARLAAMVDDAVRRELTTFEELHRRCSELARRGRRGISTVHRVLADRPGGAATPGSPFETRVQRLLMTAGIPAPVTQHPVACDGITYVLDLAWPDRLVAVECDGFRFHRTPSQLDWDDRRRNALGLRGWLVHHVTWRQLRDDPDELVEGVRRALRSRAPQ